ncbi:MAG: O-antigen ligase family protein [Oceanicaulis sp.]
MLKSISAFACLAIIAAAAALFGADTPAAALLLSAGLCAAALITTLASNTGATPLFLGWLGLVGGWLVIGLFQPGWISSGAHEYAALAGAAAVWMSARAGAQTTRVAERLWRATLALGLVTGAIAFISFFAAPENLLWWQHPYGRQTRLSTPFLSPNTAATFYSVIAVMAVAEILRALRSVKARASLIGQVEARIQASALGLITALVSLSCVFLTASRAGATVCALAIAALIIWQTLSRWRSGESGNLASWATPMALIGVLAGAFILSGALYADRLEATILDENTDRAILLAAYWRAVELAPWLGHGPGGFHYVNALIADAGNAAMIMNQGAAHNVLQQWLLQAGLGGAAIAALILVTLVQRVARGLWRRRQQTLYLKAVIVIAALVLAHGMVDYALEIPAFMWLFAWVLGLGAGIASGGSRPERLTGRSQTLVKITGAYVLAIAAGLSLYAAQDRLNAQSVRTMDAERFLTRISQGEASLPSGSAWLLEAYADQAFRLDAPDASLARAALQRAIVREPRHGVLWMKLAYAEYLAGPGWTDNAVSALRHSYFHLPYARVTRSERLSREDNLRDWRLAFAAVDWANLPEDVRAAARREARLLPARQRRAWHESVGEPET